MQFQKMENLGYEADGTPGIETVQSVEHFFPEFRTPTDWTGRYAEKQIPQEPIVDPLPTLTVRLELLPLHFTYMIKKNLGLL